MNALLTHRTFLATLAALVGLTALVALYTPQVTYGSVPAGGEYQGTTTQATAGAFGPVTQLQTGYGALGSVVITGASAGTIDLYDATTSDITKRTGQKATSTILLASFPASAAANTYTFDRIYVNGLLVVTTGVQPTSTITFR